MIAETASPARPFDRCRSTSERLVRDLSKAGIACAMIRTRGHASERPRADRRWLRLDRWGWIHYAVEIPGLGITVDPTWRQFEKEGPSVLILSTTEYDLLWNSKEQA